MADKQDGKSGQAGIPPTMPEASREQHHKLLHREMAGEIKSAPAPETVDTLWHRITTRVGLIIFFLFPSLAAKKAVAAQTAAGAAANAAAGMASVIKIIILAIICLAAGIAGLKLAGPNCTGRDEPGLGLQAEGRAPAPAPPTITSSATVPLTAPIQPSPVPPVEQKKSIKLYEVRGPGGLIVLSPLTTVYLSRSFMLVKEKSGAVIRLDLSSARLRENSLDMLGEEVYLEDFQFINQLVQPGPSQDWIFRLLSAKKRMLRHDLATGLEKDLPNSDFTEIFYSSRGFPNGMILGDLGGDAIVTGGQEGPLDVNRGLKWWKLGDQTLSQSLNPPEGITGSLLALDAYRNDIHLLYKYERGIYYARVGISSSGSFWKVIDSGEMTVPSPSIQYSNDGKAVASNQNVYFMYPEKERLLKLSVTDLEQALWKFDPALSYTRNFQFIAGRDQAYLLMVFPVGTPGDMALLHYNFSSREVRVLGYVPQLFHNNRSYFWMVINQSASCPGLFLIGKDGQLLFYPDQQ